MIKKEEIFSSVVENAFDFFDKSLKEFDQKKYKYSIIHFCAAVELFLKARLLHEHWTLIVSKREDLNLDKFIAGNSQSATLDEIKKRLEFVLKDGLSRQAASAFDNLTSYRNQVIHFCHPDLSKTNSLKIVSEQCVAWHYLQELLTTQWKEFFKNYTSKITNINNRVKKNREYLNEKYKLEKNQIKKEKAKGTHYDSCPTCGYEALQFSAKTEHLFSTKCVVCDFRGYAVEINCPKCTEKVTFLGEGFAECSCGKKLDSKDLHEIMFDKNEAYINFKDGDDSYRPGNCCDCDTREVVIPYSEEFFCLNCFEMFASIYTCEWCNELQTSSTEDSYMGGCQFCDGKFGNARDD